MRDENFSAVGNRRNDDTELQRRNFKIVAVRINSRVVVAESESSAGFLFGVDAGRLSESEHLRVGNHFRISQTRANRLKITVVGMRQRVVEIHRETAGVDFAVFVDDVFVDSGDGGHEFNRRTRFKTVANRPILIDDGQNFSRLRFHHENRSGVISERVDGGGANFQIFAFDIVVRDVFDGFRAKSALESDAAGLGFAGELGATLLFG